MKEALYYEKLDGRRTHCRLCPHECVIRDGARGFCGIRANKGGILYAESYGKATSIALDPVEKKPLYRYHPGEYILSLGTSGCNFRCQFCQNYSISQDLSAPVRDVTPDQVVKKAEEAGSFGIAYTYNEPFIWYEFVIDTARLAVSRGFCNVLVTNGFVNPQPLEEILPYIGAMNIDLKSMDDDFYKRVCAGRLEPVLGTIKRASRSCHVELTNLIIPTLNDSEDAIGGLVDWVFKEVGPETPLHFSRYFPCYKMSLPPTPVETLKMAEKIAKRKLKYVYLGNV